MTNFRARPGDLASVGAMPFQTHYEYATTLPLADVIHSEFFLPVRDQLWAGDCITLCRFDNPDFQNRDRRLLEVATVRVVRSGRGHQDVPLHLMGEIETIKQEADAGYAVKRGFAGKWRVVNGEELVSEHPSRDEAEQALTALSGAY